MWPHTQTLSLSGSPSYQGVTALLPCRLQLKPTLQYVNKLCVMLSPCLLSNESGLEPFCT